MRLHCKAVATKADKTSSISKFLAWREETGCQQTDLHFCCWHETAVKGRAEHVRSARVIQTSTCSAIASASSTSMPRYLTVLSIFVCPSRS